MHHELKLIANSVSQWPKGAAFIKLVRNDGAFQIEAIKGEPVDGDPWFSHEEWYQARRTLDFPLPLPSRRIDVAPVFPEPAPPLPVKPAPASSPLGDYQWGFEYTVKGVKPEIADDVRVSYICEGGLTGECELSKLGWNTDCKTVETIRIIDPRYKPAIPAIEVGKQCIHGNELMWVIGENHFHPGYYFLSLSETQLQTALKQVSGEHLEPVTEELSTLIKLTNSVVISKKIIEAGFKRG